jgi:hypothetical protein
MENKNNTPVLQDWVLKLNWKYQTTSEEEFC